MNEIIYLEPSEEITSVIDRLRTVSGNSVAFVIPRGATIAQSIVNLKLLKRSAAEMQKEISLVATDRISRNLASQIGLTVYSKVSEAEKAKPVVPEAKVAQKDELDSDNENSQFKVNNYYQNKNKEEPEEPEEDEELKSEIKQIVEEQDQEEVGDTAKHEVHHNSYNEEEDDEVEIRKRPIVDNDRNYEPPKDKKIIHPMPKPNEKNSTNIKGSRKKIMIFVSVFLLISLISSYLFLPSATAKIQVKTEDFSTEKEITVDRSVKEKNTNNLTVSGSLLELEKESTEQFDATGKKDMGEKATGTLTFSNNAGIDDQIAAGAIVKSSGGVEFTVDQAVSVPKASLNAAGDKVAGKSSGKVTAKNAGEKSNLPSTSTYSVTGKNLITASGETSGGVSKEVKIVTEEDLTKAQLAVKEIMLDAVKKDLADLADKDKLSIFDNGISNETISFSPSKNINDEADKFSCTLKLKFYAIGFSKKDLNDVLIASSESGLGADKMLIDPEEADITYDLIDSSNDNGTLKIKSKLVGKSGQKLVEDTIKNQIKGKSVNSAKQIILGNKDVEKVDISVRFSPLKRIPLFAKNIKITFGFAE
ncbi:MAG: hypothetical protein WC536_02680 [Patescibacteria group bacterium]